MGLGNNRDYKTTHDRAVRNLAAHMWLWKLYQELGIETDEASALAAKMVLTAKTRRKIWRTR